MKRAVLILVLAACSSTPDPHEPTVCGEASGWQIDDNPYAGACELGCKAGPIDAVDADDNGEDDRCATACPNENVTEIDGLVGCCTAQGVDGPFVFAECE